MKKTFVKLRFAFLLLISIFVLIAALVFSVRVLRPQKAALSVQSSPQARVFVDDVEVGVTPYKMEFSKRQITLNLRPEGFAAYNAKVKLVPGVTTVVRRNFGASYEVSSGEIISFEKKGGKEASISVISTPQAAQVFLNDTFYDFTPTKLTNVSPGEHELGISAIGYLARNFTVKAEEGYNLTAIVELASDPNYEDEEVLGVSDPAEGDEEKVVIKDTPTGFLRVREKDSTSSREIAKVSPGEEFVFVKANDDKSWFEIELEDGSSGWVSANYAEMLHQSDSSVDNPDDH